jgi:hypothetical protein
VAAKSVTWERMVPAGGSLVASDERLQDLPSMAAVHRRQTAM